MSILRRMVSFLLTFAAANAMAISLQYVTLKPYQDSLKDWMGTHITLYLLSTFILYLLIVGLGALVNNVYFAIGLTAALIGSVSFSQYHKLKLLGEPLYPWDLKQLVNLSEMLKIARGIASPAVLIAAAGGVVLALAATFALPRVKRKLPSRMAWVAAGLLTVFFCFHIQHSVFAKPLAKMGMVNYNWNQRENYLMNGFMLAFLQNINSKVQNQPPDYNEAAVSQVAGKYASLAANTSGINGEKPNIVVVMDESLFDPTRLSGVTFSEDPMANIHRLQAVYPSGTTLSPMYGGEPPTWSSKH
ncbi:hypothetical protein N6H14_28020 [Paenibacillus sp. CC-CFT747]|nr:hypothetical protein N6H14_28020 [Paenibacillus sp. CC-CFT747]